MVQARDLNILVCWRLTDRERDQIVQNNLVMDNTPPRDIHYWFGRIICNNVPGDDSIIVEPLQTESDDGFNTLYVSNLNRRSDLLFRVETSRIRSMDQTVYDSTS